ncbi:ankyrin repeat domain-containing protein [Parachlamydia sp. AcF125]|uniref:ankyrin repeat domain-containing protein n=1 Tax=Parachlamydia sp. AcF125 TaxID=2795736 RepID=UPI001BC94BE9|nr:ankyrin repeat domain-containing protein [Parachlamydia sp. AcF125]MBS4168680.1 hypothetical protein [Parachlamydia sp. AcF125]
MNSLQNFIRCEEFCAAHPSGRFLIQVNEETTEAEFKQFLADNPDYKLEYCAPALSSHALSRAALVGNVPLVRYILQKEEGKRLVNVGDEDGWTPLIFAAKGPKQTAHKVTELLLANGANPNIATNAFASYPGLVPENATPLYVAAEKARNLKLVRLLLSHGAVLHPPISEEVKTFLRRAYLELAKEKRAI